MDGSCYFHCIIDSFYIPYKVGRIKNTPFDRKEFIKKFRSDLAKRLDWPHPVSKNKTYFQTLSRGKSPELSKEIPGEITLDGMKNHLLTSGWASYIYHELVSDILGYDIYILNNDIKDVYIIDSGMMKQYYKNRKSIVLLFFPQGHFELICIKIRGKINTLFEWNDPFIKAIRRRIGEKI